jgi:hypothetical protein
MRCLLLVLALAACGDDGGSAADGGMVFDGTESFDSCNDTTCMTTAATATFAMPAGAVTRTLTEAYYGITASTQQMYLEVLGGGTGQCPQMASPTEDYTLVMANVEIPTNVTPQSPSAALFDYAGDLLPGGELHAFGTTTTLTPIAARTPLDAAGYAAFDLMIAFDGDAGTADDGSMIGHLYARHCASLDVAN